MNKEETDYAIAGYNFMGSMLINFILPTLAVLGLLTTGIICLVKACETNILERSITYVTLANIPFTVSFLLCLFLKKEKRYNKRIESN